MGTKQKPAFTLAEVLITLGIIGIVAAITLPALIQKNNEIELTSRAKKAYSALNQAVKMFEVKNETPGDIRGLFEAKDNSPDAVQLAEDFSKYFNGAKVCKNKNQSGCANYYYKISYASPRTDGNGTLTDWNGTEPKIILADGTVIGIVQYQSCYWKQTGNQTDQYGNIIKGPDGNPLTSTWMSTVCGDIIMDTNGPKRPNKFGADAFSIQIYATKIKPSGYQPLGGNSLSSLLTNGKLIFTNYKSGEKLNF